MPADPMIFGVRDELRFPVKRRNVISQVCRQDITEERDLVKESGVCGRRNQPLEAGRNLGFALEMNAPTLATVDSCHCEQRGGISTAIVKEMVAGSRQKLDVEANDFNRLIR